MATAEELAADALTAANKFLAEQQKHFVERAAGELDLLADAARIVREGAAHGSSLEHPAEHLAFSLLAAAFEATRKDC